MARKRTNDEEGGKPPDDGDDERPPTLGNPDADPVRIHREYVERHLGGGAEPTPEEYARALEEWRKLPGVVSRPPADVPVDEDTELAKDEDEDDGEEAEPGGDEERRS